MNKAIGAALPVWRAGEMTIRILKRSRLASSQQAQTGHHSQTCALDFIEEQILKMARVTGLKIDQFYL